MKKLEKIIKKGKNVFLTGLAGLALLTTVSCKTFESSEWNLYDTEEKIEDLDNFKATEEVEYKINSQNIVSHKETIYIPITQVEYKNIFSGKQKVYFNVYKREDTYTTRDPAQFFVGLLGGGLLGAVIGANISPEEKANQSAVGFGIGTGILGGILFISIGKKETESTRITKTQFKEELPPTLDKLTNKILVSENKQAEDIKVFIRSQVFPFIDRPSNNVSHEISVRTDKMGIAKAEIGKTSSFLALTKEKLKENIKNYSLINEIKEPLRTKLLPLIESKIKEERTEIEVKTQETSFINKKIINDSKFIPINILTIKDREIYNIIKEFIDQEINSKIKVTEFTIKNLTEPPTPIKDTTLILDTPTQKMTLAKEFFEWDLLNFAVDNIISFENISVTDFTDYRYKTLHIPSNYKIEINNPRFNLQLNYENGIGKNQEITSKTYNWAQTKEELIKQITNSKLIEEIKPQSKAKLLPKILEKIIDDNYEFIIKSDDSKKQVLRINGKYLAESEVYNVLKEYIDQEINSNIKKTTIIVQDKNSHVEIPDVKVEMNIEGAPTKRDLAGDYFTGELLEWAISQIRTYNSGEFSQYTDRQGIIEFNAYIPSKFKFETKHSQYHAFEKSTDFKEDNLEKTIRLIDIGQKLRLEQEEKRGGDLIEK